MDRASKEKTSKKTEDLDNTANQLDLTDIIEHTTQHSKTHILFKCTWNILREKPYFRS